MAIKKDHKQCQNPAHQGYLTCGIQYHRSQDSQLRSNQAETTPHRVPDWQPLGPESDNHEAETSGQGGAHQAQSSPEMTEVQTGFRPLPGTSEPEGFYPQLQPKEKNTAPTKDLGVIPTSPIERRGSVSGSHSANVDWGYLRADIQGYLATTITDLEGTFRRESESLSSEADRCINKIQKTLHSILHTSFSTFRDEQDRRERTITNQIGAFNESVNAIQKSVEKISVRQEQSNKELQRACGVLGVLEGKIDAVGPKDEQHARSWNESLHHHHNQMEILVKSHLDMLAAGLPHGKMYQEGHVMLEQKIDAVFEIDRQFARTLSESLTGHHNRIDALFRKSFDGLMVSHQQSHTVLHSDNQKMRTTIKVALDDGLEQLKGKIGAALCEDRETLEGKIDAIVDEDQGIARTLAEFYQEHRSQISALAKSHFDHKECLDNGLTKLADDFTNTDSLMRNFCVQMQVLQPGINEDSFSKALRRKRADQVCCARPIHRPPIRLMITVRTC